MDLFQADRIREELREIGLTAEVMTAPDLWDLRQGFKPFSTRRPRAASAS